MIDTLAMTLLKNGDIKGAQRSSRKSLEINAASSLFLYHSALIDVAAGDTQKAQDSLQSLLDRGVNFSGKDEAVTLLRKLQNGQI